MDAEVTAAPDDRNTPLVGGALLLVSLDDQIEFQYSCMKERRCYDAAESVTTYLSTNPADYIPTTRVERTYQGEAATGAARSIAPLVTHCVL